MEFTLIICCTTAFLSNLSHTDACDGEKIDPNPSIVSLSDLFACDFDLETDTTFDVDAIPFPSLTIYQSIELISSLLLSFITHPSHLCCCNEELKVVQVLEG